MKMFSGITDGSSLAKSRGFSLLELLVAMAVVVIIVSLALPSLTSTIQNNRVSGATNEFISAFQFARSEALKRGSPVTVCAADTSDGEDEPECADDWAAGWMVFTDTAAVGSGTPVVGELLRVWQPRMGDMDIDEGSSGSFVRYLPAGRVDGTPVPPLVFALRIDNCTRDQARDVTIERAGSVRVERVNCT